MSQLTLSETTGRRLSELIAVEVMQWKKVEPSPYVGEKLHWVSGPNSNSFESFGTSWRPDSNIKHAWRVVARVGERELLACFKSHLHVDFFRLSEHEACVAICEAALECVRGK
jgi:hypothetical protein